MLTLISKTQGSRGSRGKDRQALLLEGIKIGVFASALPAIVLLFSHSVLAQVLVDSIDQTGSRSTPPASGVVAANGWTEAAGGFKITWTISQDSITLIWTYSYTFTDKDGSPIDPETSHILLEVSTSIDLNNINDVIFNSNAPVVGPQTWTADPNSPNSTSPGANNGNPNLPADLYGIKLDQSLGTYTFQSTRPPIWGDFYTKDGAPGGDQSGRLGTSVSARTQTLLPRISRPGFRCRTPWDPNAVTVWSTSRARSATGQTTRPVLVSAKWTAPVLLGSAETALRIQGKTVTHR